MVRPLFRRKGSVQINSDSKWSHRLLLLAIAVGLCVLTVWQLPSRTLLSSMTRSELVVEPLLDKQEEEEEEQGFSPVKYISATRQMEKFLKVTTNPQMPLVRNPSSNWRGYKNRTIAVVHVGKAGGLTLRGSTAMACSANNKERCMNRRFGPKQILSRQVHYALHMHDIKKDVIQNVTSFLVTTRNPVDRIISTYRYSHIGNCFEEVQAMKGPKPFGCDILRNMQSNTNSRIYSIYNTCFPLPAMEDFAQNSLPPYTHNLTGMSSKKQDFCRHIAYNMVAGNGPPKPAPHMWYNYEYYLKYTMQAFPDREVFAARTEHEWDDLIDLDLAIGGEGQFHKAGDAMSHGSDMYAPSPLSTEAYQKLCCVLEKEISSYETILNLAQNLNETQIQESMDSVKQKCGIAGSWQEWREECKLRLKAVAGK